MPLAPLVDFLATFRERHDCFAELLALSNEQLALIEASDYSQLLTVLGRKQRILGRLEEIHRLHPRLVTDWRVHRDRMGDTTRSACEHTLARTEELLEELMALERTGTDRIVQRRHETRVELQGLAAGSRAQTAYQPLPPGGNRLLNERG